MGDCPGMALYVGPDWVRCAVPSWVNFDLQKKKERVRNNPLFRSITSSFSESLETNLV
jgi:hypothetical protein